MNCQVALIKLHYSICFIQIGIMMGLQKHQGDDYGLSSN